MQESPRYATSRFGNRRLADVVVDTDAWRDAYALNRTINDLEDRALKKGWNRLLDDDYRKLDVRNAFDRADGPSSVTAYLKKVLRDIENGKK